MLHAPSILLLLQPVCEFFLRDLAVLTLLLFLLRFLAPSRERFLRDFARTDPCKAALILAAVDFQQFVLRMALHILPHRADFLAGATTAVEHAAAIFCTAVNRERKIFAAVFASAHHDLFFRR